MAEPIPDLEISATVRARELRFQHVPHVEAERLEFPAGLDSGDTREGLPERVSAGRTYRNVGIRGWLRTRLVNRS